MIDDRALACLPLEALQRHGRESLGLGGAWREVLQIGIWRQGRIELARQMRRAGLSPKLPIARTGFDQWLVRVILGRLRRCRMA